MLFTLTPHRWYGWQMLPGYCDPGSYEPFYCPCHLRSVQPQKSGKGLLTLDVWVTGYAEGVNNGEIPLKILYRGESYLVAEILYPEAPQIRRCVIISEVSGSWLEKCFGHGGNELVSQVKNSNCPDDTQYWMENFFRPSGRWSPELWHDEVIACALQFDGAKLDCELQEGESGATYEALSKNHNEHFASAPWRLHDDPLVNWGEFFWLQRSDKWGGLDVDGARLMARLFVALHDQNPPQGYEVPSYGKQYDKKRDGARALAALWKRFLAETDKP